MGKKSLSCFSPLASINHLNEGQSFCTSIKIQIIHSLKFYVLIVHLFLPQKDYCFHYLINIQATFLGRYAAFLGSESYFLREVRCFFREHESYNILLIEVALYWYHGHTHN